jgi:methanogenic corrinoid protein MtbC1
VTVFTLDISELSHTYLGLIGGGDEYAAVELVTGLLNDGVLPQRIMIDLIGRAQSRVGELWADNEWSIAREHAATAISERALAAVAARTNVPPRRGRITVACVDGEWHALPVRLLGEMLRLDGWRVDFLGASVPGPHLETHLHQTGPDAVALSCMLPTRLPRAHAAIAACRSSGVPVIAGGRGFGPYGRYAEKLGADVWAAGAEDWPPPMRDPSATAYLGDEEYTSVVRARGELIQTALRRLAEAFPAVRAYDQRQRDSTAEDLAHIVDFLAAALYAGEEQILIGFVDWTAGVLAARDVPPAALTAGLRVVRDQLLDHPQASSLLAAGLGRLGGA